MNQVNKVAAIIGGGVIGGGWAARFLLNGWDVQVSDPDPQAERKINEVLANARRSLPALYDVAMPAEGKLRFVGSIAEAVAGASWVQESVPERLDIKHKVLADITAAAGPDTVVASSTSGFMPSELQQGSAQAGQILVCHPFNPVYLLPLIEVVPSPATRGDIAASATAILDSIGMKPLLVRKEIDAHIADRFLEAVWREGLWLINDGIATTQEIDDAIIYGFGLRWAQMGLFDTYRVAGGEAGMRHFISQFGPALAWPWTKLMDVPELTDELIDTIANQSDAQSAHMSIREMERIRDDNLVGMMRALKKNNWAAGQVIARHEEAITPPFPEIKAEPLVLARRQVPQSWTDYNGHMNETHYLELYSIGGEVLLDMIGSDEAYVASGKSYFTAENHVIYANETKQGDMVTIKAQVLEGQGKKLRVFYWIELDDGALCATGEQMLIHVDLKSRRACDPDPEVMAKVRAIAEAHAGLPMPDGAGRAIGAKR
jgi:carnitine 3-dehydrogenase